MTTPPLLALRGLCVEAQSPTGALRVVDDLNLEIGAGEAVGLVGESGSGKTLTALSILGLLPGGVRVVGGEALWRGRVLPWSREREMRAVRGRQIGYVFQESMSALNPVLRVGTQLAEAVAPRIGRRARRRRIEEALAAVQLTPVRTILSAYPHQLSGGMQQRVLIAMCLLGGPELLIADEPTTGLDVTVRVEVLDLLWRLRDERKMAMLFITHDISMLRRRADRVAVLYAGQIAEEGSAAAVFAEPRHPYTRAMLAATPRLGGRQQRLSELPGQAPRGAGVTSGCAFAPRCPAAVAACRSEPPPVHRTDLGMVRCVLP